MRRSLLRSSALLLTFALAALPGCKKGENADASEQDDGKVKDEAGEDGKAEDGKTPAEAGEAEAGAAAEAGAEGGAAEGAAEAGAAEGAAEAGAAEAGEAEAGEAEAGAEEAGETGEEDPIPGLFELAKSLDSDDAAATKALNDAIAAGASKLDAAKAANARGEALMTKGEGERAETFFTWSRDAHKLYSDPVYNLATLAANSGDLDLAKEHLAELQKRGNKKLMKKVGVEPAFMVLHDDPDVRKIYEQ